MPYEACRALFTVADVFGAPARGGIGQPAILGCPWKPLVAYPVCFQILFPHINTMLTPREILAWHHHHVPTWDLSSTLSPYPAISP